MSWFYLGKALQTLEPNKGHPIYQTIKAYITENRKFDEFCPSELFDFLFPSEGDVKLNQIQARIKIKERHRQTLLDQVRVFNQSRNFEIEKQAIDKFCKFFPNDKIGVELRNNFENEELQRFFKRYNNERKAIRSSSIKAFDEKEQAILNSYFQQILKTISLHGQQDGPLTPKDQNGFVYFFIFLEDHAHALQLWPTMEKSLAKDWLYLDLLMNNKKFVDALAYFSFLDEHYGLDANYYTSKIYYVAQCYWGLGEKRKAIELMENLTKIKPDYRLAASILRDWRAEA